MPTPSRPPGLSLRTKFLGALLIPCVLVGVATSLVFVAFQHNESDMQWVSHTYEVLRNASLLRVYASEAACTDPLRAPRTSDAVSEFVATTNVLARLVVDNPPQGAALQKVSSSFMAWRESANADPELFRNFTAAIEAFAAEERRLLAQRLDASDVSNRRAQLVALLPLAALLVAGTLLGLLAVRVVQHVNALALASNEVAQGNLTPRVTVDSRDELTLVARSFNAMAEHLARREVEIELFDELNRFLQSCSTLEEAYGVAAALAPRLLPESSGAVALMAPSRNHFQHAFGWGRQTDAAQTFSPGDCWALKRGHTYTYDPARNLPCPHLAAVGPIGSVCIPLNAQNDVLGLLVLWQSETAARVGSRVLPLFAEQLSLSLANLRLRNVLRTQSIKDSLTSLYNRRYLEETFERELARCRREKQALSLLMIDVDHFKRFNDSQGHEAGDRVLKTLGGLLVRFFRGSDVVCRYGGEEFCVLMPNATAAEAELRANLLREEVSRLSVEIKGMELPRITISVGVAQVGPKTETLELLCTEADTALYESKRAGRDRVTVARAATPA